MANLRRLTVTFLAALAALATLPATAQDKSIVVASTTSTEQSGLFGHILPAFTAKTGRRKERRSPRARARPSRSPSPSHSPCTTSPETHSTTPMTVCGSPRSMNILMAASV